MPSAEQVSLSVHFFIPDLYVPNMSKSSELNEDAMDSMDSGATPDNRKRTSKYGLSRFYEWLNKRGLGCDYGTIKADELNLLLYMFYPEAKAVKSGQT